MSDDALLKYPEATALIFICVVKKVSAFAIGLAVEQRIQAMMPAWEHDEPCGKRLSTAMGIPCKHRFRELKVQGDILSPSDFYEQWILDGKLNVVEDRGYLEVCTVTEDEPSTGLNPHSPEAQLAAFARLSEARQIEILAGSASAPHPP
ncbi:hypothetical protein DFS34DRAFT_651285 [Phlyctochytrium arcticum]|nr:hypothetical protein DFS34DRAFT_651285 [Phlyctochytrium arcticum]